MNADRVSRTSQLIAAALLHAATRPALASLLPREDLDLYREKLPLCSAYARRLMKLSLPGVRVVARLLEKILLPGIVAHYVIRKKILRDIAEQAVRTEGLQQVVILGAGLDLLGLRLARGFPRLMVFETDRIESTAMKERLLEGNHPSNLLLHSHDVNFTSLEDALNAAAGFQHDRPTVVIAEGMLMYCPVDEVRKLFAFLAALFVSPVRLLFTFMEDGPSGRIQFRHQHRLVTWWLARSGEPFRWGMSAEAMEHFLGGTGFMLERIVHSAKCAAENDLLPASATPPAAGELIAVARSRTAGRATNLPMP